jgi:hypothetical protein
MTLAQIQSAAVLVLVLLLHGADAERQLLHGARRSEAPDTDHNHADGADAEVRSNIWWLGSGHGTSNSQAGMVVISCTEQQQQHDAASCDNLGGTRLQHQLWLRSRRHPGACLSKLVAAPACMPWA